MWDIATGEALLTVREPHGDRVHGLAFSPDGTRLAVASGPELFTAGPDGKVEVFDAASGERLLTLPEGAHTYLITDVGFTPDGEQLITSGFDGTAKIWDAASGQLLFGLRGHTAPIWEFALSPAERGKLLATGSHDNTVKLWDISTGQTLREFSEAHNVFDVAFSPDAKRLAIGLRDGTTLVRDVATGEVLLTLTGHTSFVRGVIFSPDGTRLATAGFDGLTKVWNAATGQELLTLSSHTNSVVAITFSPDARSERLVTSSLDGTTRVHVLPIEDLIALAQSRVTRSLTPDECQKYLHVDQCP
jgi:WD40 repeat protein